MSGPGMTVVRRQLGARLRRLRIEANYTLRGVAAAGIFSESKLFRIEQGKNGVVKSGDVWTLCAFYEVSSTITKQLTTLAVGTGVANWWDEEPGLVPGWLGLYLGLEGTANLLASYHPELVHGLLQTEAYARAVITGGARPVEEEVVNRVLKLRVERQRVLERPDFNIKVVLGTGTFDLMIGGAEVMAEQRRHLCQLNQRMEVDIRVVDVRVGPHSGMRGPFTLMNFPDEDDPTVVYVESLTGGRYLEEADQVAAYRQAFTELLKQSIPIEEMS